MKKAISLLMMLALLAALVPAAYAAENESADAAETLYALGLFKGKGANADGTPIYALEDAPTRMEAITMLVRLLGKEEEALAGSWDMPFTDVDDWAKPYVGYAYANGLTKGTGDTTFGGTAHVTASQYLTFVLRALGYDSSTDFEWNAAWKLTDQLEITHGEYSAENDSGFLRGDVATVSVSALQAAQKDSEKTLAQKLITDGVFTEEQYQEEIAEPEATELREEPVEETEEAPEEETEEKPEEDPEDEEPVPDVSAMENGEIVYLKAERDGDSRIVETKAMLRLFPTAACRANSSVSKESYGDRALDKALADALYLFYTNPNYADNLLRREKDYILARSDHSTDFSFILDADGNTLAYFDASLAKDAADSIPFVVWRTDGVAFWAELMDKMDRAIEKCQRNKFSVDLDTVALTEADGDTWHDIYMNGVKLSELPGTFALRRSIPSKAIVATEDSFREYFRKNLFGRIINCPDQRPDQFSSTHIRISSPDAVLLYIILDENLDPIGYLTTNIDPDFTVA